MSYKEALATLATVADEDRIGFHRALQELPEKEFQNLQSYYPMIKARLAHVEESLRVIKIEQSTDYELLVKQARKRFNAHDISILEQLLESGEGMGYHISYLADKEHPYGPTRLRLRRLRRLNLVDYFRGGWTEDGDMFGSGYMLNDNHRGTVERIIDVWHGPEKQESLLDE